MFRNPTPAPRFPGAFSRLMPSFLAMLAALLAVFAANSAIAKEAAVAQLEEPTDSKPGEKWVRLRSDAAGKPVALEVAVVRYVPSRLANLPSAEADEYVDLVGAVHIGDVEYYEELNELFHQYDALLYELVAPEGTVVERGRGTSNYHPVGAVQNSMKATLELEHQLEKIDYKRPNFVHADMTPEQFRASMEERDESFLQLFARMMGQAMAEQSQQAAQGQSTDLDILTALFSQDRPRRLKIALAKQFESMESMLSAISGPEGSTLITERNNRALEVLREQQAAGKQKLGIFYGAGHLPHMHEKLQEDFQLQPVSVKWLSAWDLRE